MDAHRLSRILRWSAASAFLLIAVPGIWPQAADDESTAVRMFIERIDRYVRLRDRLAEPLPSADTRRSSWSMLLTRRYLASAIRAARASAEPGEVFAPAVAEVFRRRIAEAIYDIDVEGLDDRDREAVVDVVVNEPLPAWSLESVPPAIAERLPPLPGGLEYRLVNGALVLWDVDAEILVDVLPDAFAAR